jgi:hypothetical protein
MKNAGRGLWVLSDFLKECSGRLSIVSGNGYLAQDIDGKITVKNLTFDLWAPLKTPDCTSKHGGPWRECSWKVFDSQVSWQLHGSFRAVLTSSPCSHAR